MGWCRFNVGPEAADVRRVVVSPPVACRMASVGWPRSIPRKGTAMARNVSDVKLAVVDMGREVAEAGPRSRSRADASAATGSTATTPTEGPRLVMPRWCSARRRSGLVAVVMGLLALAACQDVTSTATEQANQTATTLQVSPAEVELPEGFPTQESWPAGWDVLRRSLSGQEPNILTLRLLANITRFTSSPPEAPPLPDDAVVSCAITLTSSPLQCQSGVVIAGVLPEDLAQPNDENRVDLEVWWDDVGLRFTTFAS